MPVGTFAQREIKSHEIGPPVVLRSQEAERVRQEPYGYFRLALRSGCPQHDTRTKGQIHHSRLGARPAWGNV